MESTAKHILADILKPKNLNDFLGQRHLFAPDALLYKLISNGNFSCLIFVGPPGTGKTTLAHLASSILSLPFFSLHAATATAGDLKKLSEFARGGTGALLFIDEIHRYNKTQQNLLLKLIDERAVKIIGASAENPVYTLVPAFRSRSLIFHFKPLADVDLKTLAERAYEVFKEQYEIEEVDGSPVFEELVREAAGDARRFVNMLEVSAMLGRKKGGVLTLSLEGAGDILAQRRFNDDEYYDLLSAMIKSIRGSDPDAALLWGVKLLMSGVTSEAIFRRLMISASEDIGNAFPDALVFVNSAFEAYMNVGEPEGEIILAHAITFLASCPKSNRSYLALNKAKAYLAEHDALVPKNIAHNAAGYLYPHSYEGGFVRQSYAPKGIRFYEPTHIGFEKRIAERLKELWETGG